jgi:glycine hydroxymethyltransferase
MKERGFRLVSGGTDNHLVLVDLRGHNVNGKDAQNGLEDAGITVNKNTIPYDPEKPFIASGIRIGSPAVTTRGMREEQMEKIGDWMAFVLDNIDDADAKERVRGEIHLLCEQFPLHQVSGKADR